jgi:hypothetical protein
LCGACFPERNLYTREEALDAGILRPLFLILGMYLKSSQTTPKFKKQPTKFFGVFVSWATAG